jgi:rhodanese-related sulfurtransferase
MFKKRDSVKLKLIFLTILLALHVNANELDAYLKSFDYEERKEMKIQTIELIVLLEENKAQAIDVRFPDEFEAWHMNFAKNIPLNELPDRLDELDKSKLIVTMCPHNDRANIARLYLKMKGFNVRYLSDGLLNSANFLRGDNAKEFVQEYKKVNKIQ